MIIEKVHGLQATAITLNERFTLLAKNKPARQQQQRRRNSLRNFNFSNQRLLFEQVARQLEMQARRAIKQRLGVRQVRKSGSESNLPMLRRSNSESNLSQQSVKNRVSWNNNGNNSESALFRTLQQAVQREFRWHAGGQRQMRGRFRGRGRMQGGVGRNNRVQQNRNRIKRPLTARRSRMGARGRGGINRNQQPIKLKTKEELDQELEQYMACTKAALDLDLEIYMQNALETE